MGQSSPLLTPRDPGLPLSVAVVLGFLDRGQCMRTDVLLKLGRQCGRKEAAVSVPWRQADAGLHILLPLCLPGLSSLPCTPPQMWGLLSCKSLFQAFACIQPLAGQWWWDPKWVGSKANYVRWHWCPFTCQPYDWRTHLMLWASVSHYLQNN